MFEMIQVLDSQVEKLEYEGKPVITLKQVDDLHRRPSGAAKQSFRRHKKRLIEGEDYFEVSHEEWSNLVGIQVAHQELEPAPSSPPSWGGHRGKMVFLSETGYLLVTKPFTDNRSWQVQRALITAYFIVKAAMGADAASGDTVNIPKNRYIEMLEAENAQLRGGKPAPRSNRAKTPITDEMIATIRQMYEGGKTINGIAQELNISTAPVSYILRLVPPPLKRKN